MHGLLTVKVARRTLSLAAAVAVAVILAVLAAAGPALAQAGHRARPAGSGSVAVTIDAMNPQVAEAGSTVTVRGTVSNGTSQTQAGLEVQLYSSPDPFSTRDQMDEYLSKGSNDSLQPYGNPFIIAASMAPGQTASWSTSFQVSEVGMSAFGVYPVAALVQQDDLAGSVLASSQTLLPFWPGTRTAGLASKLKIAWVWPLTGQPQAQVCPALATNDLAASLTPGGRLADLLTAGMSEPEADLTWVVDPALLGDVATMTKAYQVGGRADCTHPLPESASKSAVSWLSGLKAATSAQPTVITPYADVDMTALVHQGLTGDLATAFSLGDEVAGSVLGRPVKPAIAVPPGGSADLSLLTNLAAKEGIGTAVLSSSEMPPADTAVFEPDDAVTSIRTGIGTKMTILLADSTLTGVLADGDTSTGTLSAGTAFDVSQRFLAETAMIAAEAPGSARSVVVEPPDDWSPTETLAASLLAETASAPWLAPTTLSGLTTAPDSERTLARQPLPDSKESPGALSRAYLGQVSQDDARLRVYESMLYHPSLSYLQSLDEARAATESAAWRGSEAAQGLAMSGTLSAYLKNAEGKIRIITSAQVPMGGSSGQVPVSIYNGLLQQAIQVRLNVRVVSPASQTSPLTVGRAQKLIVVPPQDAALVRLSVSSAPIGSTIIKLSLSSANGTMLPFAGSLTVVSTRYGRAILFLIAAAIGVLILTSVFRGIRRRMPEDSPAASEEADPPGSVVNGTSSARHPTEAPDDLADARRRADDA